MGVDEGKCYVGIMLAHGANIAHASLAQIKTAAEEIMRKCTVGGHLQGGTAYNIGEQCTRHHCKVVSI